MEKEKADDYVEMVFDDIMERTENAAMWLHASPDGEACLFVTKGEGVRRGAFQRALVAGMMDDPELLEDFAVAVAHALRISSSRAGLNWADSVEE